MTNTATTPTLRWDEIIPDPRNVRANAMDGIEEMAESIRVNGVLQPLSINLVGTMIVGGHRRHAAVGLLIDQGVLERSYAIPVHFIDVTQDAERSTLQLMLVENMQRVDLNPVEEAHAFHELQDEFDLKQKEIAERIGKSPSLVSARLRLLKLPEVVLTALSTEHISLDQAEEMVPLAEYPEEIEIILANPSNWSAHSIAARADRVKLQEKVKAVCDQIGELGATGVSVYGELQELNRQSSGEKLVNPTKAEVKKFVLEGEVYYVASNYQFEVIVSATMTFDSTGPEKSKVSEKEKKIKLARKERNAAIAALVSGTSFTNPQIATMAEQYVLARGSAAANKLACTYLGVDKADVPKAQDYYQWEKTITALVHEGGQTGKRALAALMMAEFELRNGATQAPRKDSEIGKALAEFDIGLTTNGGPRTLTSEISIDDDDNEGDSDGGADS